jgi:VWFA-related protein
MIPRLAIVLSALTAGAALLGAQEATFRGGTHTVSVYATVVDRSGRLVPNLTKDDFQVFDDGKPQELTIFKNDIQPITIVIMLDRSGSMVGNFAIERDAAEQFITDLLPADKARLGSFSNRVQIDPPDFTSDQDELIRILHANLQDAGPTPLWNATFAAMNALTHQDGRRVVLVFTDGYDTPTRPTGNVSLNEVIDRSQREEIMVYAIGLADACELAPASAPAPQPQTGTRFQGRRPPRIPRGPLGPGGRWPGPLGPRIPGPAGTPPIGIPGPDMPGRRGPEGPGSRPSAIWGGGCPGTRPDSGLKLLAEEGGGGYFELRGTDDLGATFGRVAEELHQQYLLAFTATSLDGRLHKLEIKLRDPRLIPRARKSYLAAVSQ